MIFFSLIYATNFLAGGSDSDASRDARPISQMLERDQPEQSEAETIVSPIA
jgi:hypothetical protein